MSSANTSTTSAPSSAPMSSTTSGVVSTSSYYSSVLTLLVPSRFPFSILFTLLLTTFLVSYLALPDSFTWFLSTLSTLFTCLLWFLLLLFLFLWWIQSSFVYMPQFAIRTNGTRKLMDNSPGFRYPSEYQLPYESVEIECSDGVTIHGWLMLQRGSVSSARPTLLLMHGNAGNIGWRLPQYKNLYITTGCNIFALDYRGYGNSCGSPSQLGFERDAAAAFWRLYNDARIDSKQIFVMGTSIGGAVTFALASQPDIGPLLAGIIVENTFTSIADMGLALAGKVNITLDKNPIVHAICLGFLKLFLTSPWNTKAVIGSIKRPILFIAGLADELIPPAQMKLLYQMAKSSVDKEYYGVPGGMHNDTHMIDGPEYYQKVTEFIEKCVEKNQNQNQNRNQREK